MAAHCMALVKDNSDDLFLELLYLLLQFQLLETAVSFPEVQ